MSSSSSISSGALTLSRKRKQDASESSDSASADDTPDASEEGSDTPLPIEETVLSHAERRRQKKKQKRSELAVSVQSESPRKKRKLDDGTGVSDAEPKAKRTGMTKNTLTADDPQRQKRQNSVWVGNLSYRTTEEALRKFFDGVGTITRIHMPIRRPQNENMGFAYVDFESSDAKVIAVTLSEGQLDGRNLLIKNGDDFTGRPTKAKAEGVEGDDEGTDKKAAVGKGKSLSKTAQKILRLQKQPPAPTLFLGNLGFQTTEASIRELFEAHRYRRPKKNDIKPGKQKAEENGNEDKGGVESEEVWIRKIRMGTFQDSGNCKGFAFVDFATTEQATEVLVNPRNHRLNGRDLVVEFASPDAVRRGGNGPRNRKASDNRKNKSGIGRMPQKAPSSASHTKQSRSMHIEQDGNADGEEISAGATRVSRSEEQRSNRAGHDRPHTRRSKPGASLAQAQRQSAAILPSQGQKIVF